MLPPRPPLRPKKPLPLLWWMPRSACRQATSREAALHLAKLPCPCLACLVQLAPWAFTCLPRLRIPGLLQSAVAAAVAEKDTQLHAAQERLTRQLQEQLQRAEAEMEVRLKAVWRSGRCG